MRQDEVTEGEAVVWAGAMGSNWTAQEYLHLMRGPQQIASNIAIPITVVYGLIFVSGVIGNVIVCLVISRNAHFQTPTNYYLFSLAISDLLILMFGLPNDLKVYWQQYPWIFGETICKLRALIAEMTGYASVLTIVAFSTERYIAICHPLLLQKVSSLSRAIKIITCTWIAACVCAVPFAVFTKVNYLEFPNGTGHYLQESAFCALPMENNDVNLPLIQFSTFAFFCLPMTLIMIIYVKIGLRVRRARFARLSTDESAKYPPANDPRPNVCRRSIHKMLVAVVIAFFMCWAPFHTQRLFVCYFDPSEWTRELRQLNEILYYIAGCLYYFSATINPILYSLMSARYREAFREALCAFSQKRDSDPHPLRFSHRPSDFGLSDRPSSVFHDYERTLMNGCNRKYPMVATPVGNEEVSEVKNCDERKLRWTLIAFLEKCRERKLRKGDLTPSLPEVKVDVVEKRKHSRSLSSDRFLIPVINVTSCSPEQTEQTEVDDNLNRTWSLLEDCSFLTPLHRETAV